MVATLTSLLRLEVGHGCSEQASPEHSDRRVAVGAIAVFGLTPAAVAGAANTRAASAGPHWRVVASTKSTLYGLVAPSGIASGRSAPEWSTAIPAKGSLSDCTGTAGLGRR